MESPLIDVRSPKEYTGELLHMEAYPQEGALRGGHIPGARNVPWARRGQRRRHLQERRRAPRPSMKARPGSAPDKSVVAYCRIGERSSHTWFVLSYLLGYPNVRNYDGSWTEWGNLVGVPIEK
jgi:thiosulfate/3-mercaptopyruvate sulfurtransferase